MSETAKHRHLAAQYCCGNGADLGSSCDPVVPWAIQVDLPNEQFLGYNSARDGTNIQWHGSALDLPFKDRTLDFVHASHLIEDFEDWTPVLAEWNRVLKPGGYLLIAVPDHERFRALVARNAAKGLDSDNLAHRHESRVGELTEWLQPIGYEIIMDQFVSDNPEEYSIICVARKAIDDDAEWGI
jgi:ubiquinone/menaquinone biosynthesis C-methylase UbiE